MANRRPGQNKYGSRVNLLVVLLLLAAMGIAGLAFWLLGPSAAVPQPPRSEAAGEYVPSAPAQYGPLEGLNLQRTPNHDGREFHYLLNRTPAFDRKGEKGSVYIENCEGNTGYMQVEYCLENGDTVYLSPLLPPNWSVTTDNLAQPLDAGEYAVTAYIYVYNSAEAEEQIGSFEEEIQMVVG